MLLFFFTLALSYGVAISIFLYASLSLFTFITISPFRRRFKLLFELELLCSRQPVTCNWFCWVRSSALYIALSTKITPHLPPYICILYSSTLYTSKSSHLKRIIFPLNQHKSIDIRNLIKCCWWKWECVSLLYIHCQYNIPTLQFIINSFSFNANNWARNWSMCYQINCAHFTVIRTFWLKMRHIWENRKFDESGANQKSRPMLYIY